MRRVSHRILFVKVWRRQFHFMKATPCRHNRFARFPPHWPPGDGILGSTPKRRPNVPQLRPMHQDQSEMARFFFGQTPRQPRLPEKIATSKARVVAVDLDGTLNHGRSIPVSIGRDAILCLCNDHHNVCCCIRLRDWRCNIHQRVQIFGNLRCLPVPLKTAIRCHGSADTGQRLIPAITEQ